MPLVYWQLISHKGCFKRGVDGSGLHEAKSKCFYVLANIDRFVANLYDEVVKTSSCYSITLHDAIYYGSGNVGGGGGRWLPR